jgi:hypothetical protein
MARQVFGAYCPGCGGELLAHPDWSRLWCPSNRHGGNGLFVMTQDAREVKMPKDGKPKSVPGGIDKVAEEVKAAAPRTRGVPKECLCGCGGMTKGGRFRPGHDAKYYSTKGGHDNGG